jgi:hypothetical protein
MRWAFVYRVLVLLALLVLGAVEWRNCSAIKELQDQQRDLLKPAAGRES